MWLSRYFVWFILYSFMGWAFETLYCTVTTGKWANRGFLYGPICPIYGVGAVLCEILVDIKTCNILLKNLKDDAEIKMTPRQIIVFGFD